MALRESFLLVAMLGGGQLSLIVVSIFFSIIPIISLYNPFNGTHSLSTSLNLRACTVLGYVAACAFRAGA